MQLVYKTTKTEMHFQCHLPQLWVLLAEYKLTEYGGGLIRSDSKMMSTTYKRNVRFKVDLIRNSKFKLETFPRGLMQMCDEWSM